MIDNDIAKAICEWANKEGSDYSKWYCGIATDPEDRLFNEHNVPQQNAWRIHRNVGNEQDARDTEKYLLSLGFDGGGGGGDFSTKYIYAYKKLSTTIE